MWLILYFFQFCVVVFFFFFQFYILIVNLSDTPWCILSAFNQKRLIANWIHNPIQNMHTVYINGISSPTRFLHVFFVFFFFILIFIYLIFGLVFRFYAEAVATCIFIQWRTFVYVSYILYPVCFLFFHTRYDIFVGDLFVSFNAQHLKCIIKMENLCDALTAHIIHRILCTIHRITNNQ